MGMIEALEKIERRRAAPEYPALELVRKAAAAVTKARDLYADQVTNAEELNHKYDSIMEIIDTLHATAWKLEVMTDAKN